MAQSGKLSGYAMFARDIQDKMEHQGAGNLTVMAAVARAPTLWKDMTEEEKEEWKDKTRRQSKRTTKAQKKSERGTAKVTKGFQKAVDRCTPRDYYSDTEEAPYLRKRVLDIRKLNSVLYFNGDLASPLQWILAREFVVVSVIPYLETPEHVFLPAEVAVMVYKVRDGVSVWRQYLLEPDMTQLKDVRSEELLMERRDDPVTGHRIWTAFDVLQGNYSLVYKEIWKVIGKHQFMFCLADQYNDVRGCLNFLRAKYLQSRNMEEKAAKREPQLMGLEDLVKVLCHFPCQTIPRKGGPSMAEIELMVRPTELMRSEAGEQSAMCLHHRQNWNQNCAMRLARTALWGASLLLSKHCQFGLSTEAVPATRLANATPDVVLSRRQTSAARKDFWDWQDSLAQVRALTSALSSGQGRSRPQSDSFNQPPGSTDEEAPTAVQGLKLAAARESRGEETPKETAATLKKRTPRIPPSLAAKVESMMMKKAEK